MNSVQTCQVLTLSEKPANFSSLPAAACENKFSRPAQADLLPISFNEAASLYSIGKVADAAGTLRANPPLRVL